MASAYAWIEGFEICKSQNAMTRKYNTVTYGSPSFVGGYQGGTALRVSNTLTTFRTQSLRISDAVSKSIGVCFNIRNVPGLANNTDILIIQDSAGGDKLSLRYNSSTNVLDTYYQGALSQAGTITFAADEWAKIYAEVILVAGVALSSFETRVNGIINTSRTGRAADSGNTDVLKFTVQSSDGAELVYLDDIMAGQAGIGAMKNSQILVRSTLPNAAGTKSECTPVGAASNYLCMDDPAGDPDDDLTIVHDSAGRDLYNYTDLSTSGNILAIQVNVDARIHTSGSKTLKIVHRASGGTETTGTRSHTINSTTYARKVELFEASPNDDVDWTNSTLNASEFGIDIS